MLLVYLVKYLAFVLDILNSVKQCRYFAARCRAALGMHNGDIPDDSITASSSFDPVIFGPSRARYSMCVDIGHCVNCDPCSQVPAFNCDRITAIEEHKLQKHSFGLNC